MGQTGLPKKHRVDGRGDRRQIRYPFLGVGEATANSMDPGVYVARTGQVSPNKVKCPSLRDTHLPFTARQTCLLQHDKLAFYSTTDSPFANNYLLVIIQSPRQIWQASQRAGIRLQGSASQYFRRDAAMSL